MTHLTDHQILGLANGEYLPDAARHAVSCPACAAQVQQLTGSLELFRESVNAFPAYRPRPVERRFPLVKFAAAMAATAALAAMFFINHRQEQERLQAEEARQDALLMEQLYHGAARVTPASFDRFNNVATTATQGNLNQ